MWAVNPMRSRRQATDDLRRAVEGLPRATKLAMLDGIERNDIIVGAYTSREGICPMLAAHRAGGRTSYIAFAEAWDLFAQRARPTRKPRRATVRELLVLRSHLEASLLESPGAPTLASAISEHRELVRCRPAPEARSASSRDHLQRPTERVQPRGERTRPGDPDRRRELSGSPGWAWTRPFRRWEDFEVTVRRLEDPPDSRADVVDGEPSTVCSSR
jgi:hypothetical protein